MRYDKRSWQFLSNIKCSWDKYLYKGLAMKQIFLSYVSRDRDYANNLREHLTQAGYRVWVNKDARSGQNWQYAVTEAIKESAVIIALLTPNSTDSIYFTYEWAFALGAGKKVIPVIFRGIEAPHPHLMVQEQFDFGAYPEEDMFWKQFVRELQRILGDSTKAATEDIKASPSKDAGYYLLVDVRGQAPRRIPLREESISLGREATNDIQIDDAGVSRVHLRLVRLRNGGYQALDMGSTNGTFIGDDRIELLELKPSDILRIGDKITLKYEYVP